MPKSLCKAIALPRISAKEVEILAKIALIIIGLPIHFGAYFSADSLKHNPVTIPKCATLCCKAINIIVESVTTHNKV